MEVFSLFIWFFSVFCLGDAVTATLYRDSDGKFVVQEVLDKQKGIAYGSFVDEINKTGWSQLDIRSGYGLPVDDEVVMYAAGYLEGAFTARMIPQCQHNLRSIMMEVIKTDENLAKVEKFLQQQFDWMKSMIMGNKKDPFWRHIHLIYQQFMGLFDGYNAFSPTGKQATELEFLLFNAYPNTPDILAAVVPEMAPKWDEMTIEEIRRKSALLGHCSALVKVTPGYEDVLIGHTTWTGYPSMLRIFKHYSFNLQEPTTGSQTLSFSSYPGVLVSIDDYYIMGRGMVMMETTNDVYDNRLFKLVKPESLLTWQRVRVACQMAHDAMEWTDAFTRYNSGTYNNQYMIVDLNKIKVKDSIGDNALRIAEQTPGLVVSTDVTPVLRAGYFASYNVPFSEEIYNRSGYPAFVAKHGPEFSYSLAPRAKIFRRDQSKVVDIESLKHLIRYNNYKNEEYADQDPCNTICCRGDLSATPNADGCTDAKVTNYSLAYSRITHGISGPTTEGGLPVFSFTGAFKDVAHEGMPIYWNFSFVTLQPGEQLN
ncbi:phospholipase B-like [Corticium candelabrum]|uniref:phospholipase B-like n=1 Tax=Corticium candelabrum TaxID=121492 RepID=UPI002E2766B5|nr:phospholipase B-like [Corticium candelabrum]